MLTVKKRRFIVIILTTEPFVSLFTDINKYQKNKQEEKPKQDYKMLILAGIEPATLITQNNNALPK